MHCKQLAYPYQLANQTRSILERSKQVTPSCICEYIDYWFKLSEYNRASET